MYVDDGLILSQEESQSIDLLEQLGNRFKMRELAVNVYRGIEISQSSEGIYLSQRKYTEKTLMNFNMSYAKSVCNPVNKFDETDDKALKPEVPYRSAVGSLAYLADMTRPDIAFAVNQLARKLSSPTENDWKRVKQVLRYLIGTLDYGIMYQKKEDTGPKIIGYSDSDFSGDSDTSKSTTGYVIMFNKQAIHWKSQLQKHVTLSSTEAEVIALCSLSKELAWVRRMCIDIGIIKE